MHRRKHKTIDLGTIAAGGYSAEVDMSSFTHMNVFLEWPDGFEDDVHFEVQASPSEFGANADWYDIYSPIGFTGTAVAPDRLVFRHDASSGVFNALDQAMPGLGVYDGGSTFFVDFTVSEFPFPRRVRFFKSPTANTTNNSAANIKVQLVSVV